MNSNRKPRRLRRAFVLAAALFVATTALFGLASADSGSPTLDAATFRVAAAHSGDRWAYDGIATGAWDIQAEDEVRLGEPFAHSAFTWAGPETRRLDDLTLHQLERLDMQTTKYFPRGESWSERSWIPAPQTHWYLAGDDRPSVTASLVHHETSPGGSDIFGVPLPSTFATTSLTAEYHTFGPSRGPCFVKVPFQGIEMDVRDPVSVPCGPSDQGAKLVAKEAGTLRGYTTMRFELQLEDTKDSTSVWYAPDFPYPLRVETTILRDAGEANLVLDLVGFTAGTAAMASDDVADRDVRPGLEWAPRTVTGPSEVGIKMAFPVSLAFDQARADPTYGDVRDFLGRHPAAYVGGVLPFELHDGDQIERGWIIDVTSGDATMSFEAIQRTTPVTIAGVTVVTDVRYEFTTRPFALAFTSYPAPDAAPRELPTVASHLALWEAFADAKSLPKSPRGWAFTLQDLSAHGPYDAMASGHPGMEGKRGSLPPVQTPFGPPLAYSYSMATNGTVLATDGDGRPLSLIIADARSEAGLSGLGSNVVPGSQSDASPRPGSLLRAGLWPLPDSAVATGAGVLSLLAALAYWIWPGLKGGTVFGLFSRVHSDGPESHPARSRLLQQIEAQPGAHYRDLLRSSRLSKGSLEHHLRVLEAHHLVKSVRTARYTCYFPAHTNRTELAAAGALKSDGARKVLQALQGGRPLTGRDLVHRTGLSASTVSEHASRLSAAGLIAAQRDGRTVVYHSTTGGLGW